MGGYIASAEEELAGVSRISRQILSFHRDSAMPINVDLSELLDDVLALNNRAIVEKNLVVRRRRNSAICVCGFPAQLRQVFSNLVRNAIEASFPGSEIGINVSQTTWDRDGGVGGARVTIADRGVGIARENVRRIFEAFFTTKELKGTGVGLWLSSSIVHEHRGRIQVKSSTQPGRSGSCISVFLPATRLPREPSS